MMVRWLLYLAFIVIGFLLIRRLAPILAPVLAAAGIAYLLDPLVDRLDIRLHPRGVKRIWAVTLLLGLFLAVVTSAFLIIIPMITRDLVVFINDLPRFARSFSAWLEARLAIEVPASWEAALASALEIEASSAMLREVAGPASEIAAAAIGGVFSFAGAVAEILLVPVFAFYFLLDWDDIVARLRSMIPPRHRATVVSLTGEIDEVVSGWIRGQLVVVALLAVLYAVSFFILGVPLGISAGVLVGLLTIIPFLGTIVGGAFTFILVVLDWQGMGQLLGVASVFLVLHLLEAAFLTPRMVGKRVGLGETGALFAVLAGGQLLGFTGVLLAVPIAASVAVMVRRLVSYYERTAFFGAADPDSSIPKAPEPLPKAAATVALDMDIDMDMSIDAGDIGPPKEPSASTELDIEIQSPSAQPPSDDGRRHGRGPSTS